jgi:hypothetical protein
MSDDNLRETYPELFAGVRHRHPVEDATERGGTNEVVKQSFTVDDADLIRDILTYERDFGQALLMRDRAIEPGNEFDRKNKKRLERNVGRLNDLILRKF